MKAHEAIAAVMADVQAVAKTDRNSSQNFNFRGIDAVLNAVGPVLRTHGVVVLPDVISHEFDTVEVGQKRTSMGHVIVHVRYTFVGPEGDTISCSVMGEAMDSGDKAFPKAMSVAFRTALLQSLALPTDEPDPDASSYERSPAPGVATSSAYTDKELNDLLSRAEDLVDKDQVLTFANKGPSELAAAKQRLRDKLAEAEGATPMLPTDATA